MGFGLVRRFKYITSFLNEKLRIYGIMKVEHKNIRRKRKLYERVSLSIEQEQEIQNLFKRAYGKKISNKWHRLYTSYTGIFCADYFPEILFSSRLEPITNPLKIADFLGDKNLLPLFFGAGMDVHIPETYLSNVNGKFFDGNRNPIHRERAIENLIRFKDFVIKKTIETSSGRDVQIIHNNSIDYKNLLNSFGNNFVVQETIKQSKELSALNPSSINTFRVITYYCDGNYFICPVSLRMGRSNADRDNIHYGGIVVGVNSDGTLKGTAFSEYGESFKSHPDTGIVFKNYLIPEAGNKLRETAKRLHCNIPHLGIISWDLTIDSQGQITLIEMNTTGQSAWFCQMVNGEPMFGNNTEKMLSMIR